MKDKHCREFVFMPVKGQDSAPPMASGGPAAVGGERGPVVRAAAVSAAGADHSEVKSKIVVVGDCGCGKTGLIHRYVHSAFQETPLADPRETLIHVETIQASSRPGTGENRTAPPRMR
ncbi:hypothetical protein ACOMHN_005518 [Nucella lapillus]